MKREQNSINIEQEKLSLLERKCSLYSQLKELKELGVFNNEYIETMIFGDEKNKIIKEKE